MNSLKNTVVIVLLLGVSYGVFQLVNAPEPNIAKEQDPEEIEIIDDDSEETAGPEGQPLAAAPSNGFGAQLAPPKDASQLPPPLLDQPKQEYPKGLASDPPGVSEQPPMELPEMNAPLTGSNSKPDEKQVFSGPLDQNNFGSPAESSSSEPFVSSNELQMVPKKSDQNLLSNNQKLQTQNVPPPAPGAQELENAWPKVREMVTRQNYTGALKELSRFYHSNLNQGQRVELLNWLDSLAGKVIYSNDFHLGDQPYVVRDGDSIESLAQKWNVPPRLIKKINESVIADPNFLIAGTQLKRVQGPFRAEVAVGKKEMTMYLGDLYAGRFQLEFGNDQPINVGRYQVLQKSSQGKIYQDRNGQSVAAGSQFNPYGRYWLDLGKGLCIHSANTQDGRGSIRVRDNEVANVFDAADVFGILSKNSEVTIRR